ncbi:MAG: DUF4838 domain-containing protein [Clostridia bacterium]|nr:DUF4838 domain-containing protein [Clostridia bacterium]
MLKAIISLLEVIVFSLGIVPVSADIDYGGKEYTPPAVTEPMYIAENGETDFTIVLPDSESPCLTAAANELVSYVYKICGARPAVKNESDTQNFENTVLLGGTACSESLKPACEDLAEDGFLIYSDGSHLIIRGGSERGTLYGVYTFLEEYLGVRWFTPKLEKVPESKDIIIDSHIDRTVEPSFAIRRNDCAGTNDRHRARTRMNVSFWSEAEGFGGALTFVMWDVTLDRLVPDSLFTEHPEYFALGEDGKRTTDHVCLSNPDVLPVAVENARQAIENCPRESSKHIHIGQKDNENYCRCETCEALYKKYGSVSAPTILFTNAFADALDDDYPDFTFTFYAYNETDRPPADLTLRCSKNVVPVLCGLHKACRSHPLTECGAVDGDDSFNNLFGENEPRVANDFANWVKIADRTYIYDYTINFLNTAQFFSNFGTMQSTMKYMHDTGITGYVYNCGDGHEAAFNELRNYLLCKVQWDVDCDVEYWMNEFLKGYYGEAAAPFIKKIIDIQTAQISATAHAFDFDWHYQSGFYPLYTIAKLDGLWNRALNADITEEQRFNVECADLSWEYYKANLFIGKYFFLNPLRMQANEELYDAFKSHGINRVCSFGLIPEKENLTFIERPIEWR